MTLPNIDSLDTFIGAPALMDFSPVVVPETDIPAAGFNACFADVAMMSETAVRAYAVFTGGGTTLVEHDAVWGNSLSYAPVIGHTGTGIYTVTFPTSVNDVLGNAITVNLRRALPANIESNSFFFTSCSLLSVNQLQIRIANTAGSLNDASGASIWVGVL